MFDGQIENTLNRFPLFLHLSSEEVAVVAPLFKEIVLPAGTTFIKQDELSAQLYLIVAGIAEVCLPLIGERGNASIAKFGPGECVGELSLAKIARRAASAKAEVDCRCYVVDSEKLIGVFESQPKIGYRVFKNLALIMADRLVSTNMMLRNSASQG
ncbi:MAG: cyclic nucleotide-binding domain-containing protein [Betaproteobacteria bacterium]|nr:cyclic nucleotide-binding domain-containing protein [Betaproteobacteria bacterium]